MSLKRSQAGGRTHFGGGADPGAKVGRQELYDELKRLSQGGQTFAPVDVALAIGAGEPQVARTLLGLAAEGYLEKVEAGKYRAGQFVEVPLPEFVKALTRASKTDSTRQRDLSEIGRLKQNNDIMRGKLLQAIAERDHYLVALKRHGIDPGPAPAAPANVAGGAANPASAPAGVAPAPAEVAPAVAGESAVPTGAAHALPTEPSNVAASMAEQESDPGSSEDTAPVTVTGVGDAVSS
jgi:hypothetical protein